MCPTSAAKTARISYSRATQIAGNQIVGTQIRATCSGESEQLMRSPRFLRWRRPAVLLTTGLTTLAVAGTLPAPSAFAADGQVLTANPNHAGNAAPASVTFTTTHDWIAALPPSVTLTRNNTTNDIIEGSSVSVDPSAPDHVTANFDLTLANPSAYSVTVEGSPMSQPTSSAKDTCASCFTVTSPAPTITGPAPASVAGGAQYPNWAIFGSR